MVTLRKACITLAATALGLGLTSIAAAPAQADSGWNITAPVSGGGK